MGLMNPHMQAYLNFLGLDTTHLFDIFCLLDVDHSGSIQLNELLVGMGELKGPAQRVELVRLQKMMLEIFDGVQDSKEKLDNLLKLGTQPLSRGMRPQATRSAGACERSGLAMAA